MDHGGAPRGAAVGAADGEEAAVRGHVVAALLFALAVGLAAERADAEELFIRGVRLVEGTGGPVREDVDVLIAGGRIRGIEQSGTMTARGRVIDGTGLTALPGLVDAHVHFVAASGSSFRGDSEETIRGLNRRHLRAYLACGVTAVLDAGAFVETARDIQAWLAAGNPGPRYLTTGPYVRPPDGYGHPRFGTESTPAEVEAKLDLIVSLGGVGVKIGLEEGFGPLGGPAPFPPEVLAALVDGARRRGLPLYVHARTESTQVAAIDLGARALMHAALDMMAPEDLSEGFVERLARSGAYQLTTLSLVETFPAVYDATRLDDPLLRLVVPEVELATARDPKARRHFDVRVIGWGAPWTFEFTRPWIASVMLSKDRLLRSIRTAQRNLVREHRAGVPIVIGTDAPSPWPDAIHHFHGPQVAREMELVGEAGLSPVETIAAATSVPAKMLGLDAEIGTVAVGKAADVVLVAGDASTDLRALRRVRWTIRSGVARTPEEWMGE
jgi:imidazolonepropionase-like amidohydrolase